MRIQANNIDVSIIIVNYNTHQLVIDCINTIYEKTVGVTFEIIVVDNDSPDPSIRNVNQFFSEVKLVLNKENSGFGSANNIGCKVAQGKYFFFLNSDTLLLNNSVFELFQFMELNPEVGICGGNLFDVDHNPTLSFERRLPSVLNDLDRLFYCIPSKVRFGKSVSFNFDNKPIEIHGYVSGAALFISKSLFEDIGGFDEDFFMYYEETELTYRVLTKGYRVFVLNTVEIVHLEGGSQIGEVSKLKEDWMRDSKIKFYRKTNKWGLCLSNVIQKLILVRDKTLKKLNIL